MTPTPNATAVAIIGLGRMGGPIADHVIAAGYEVRVFDIADAAVAPRVAAGAARADTAALAARGAAFVHLIVLDDAQVRAVLTGPDGVLGALEAGGVVSIHTTVTLDTIDAMAEAAAPLGITVLDAGISGGEAGASAGTLLTMVGGPTEAVDRTRPILDCFSKEVLRAGPQGAGMALKLARNAAGYVMMAATHEAMALAYHAGVDLELLRHTIAETGVLAQALAPFAMGGPTPLPADAPAATRASLEHTNRLAEKDLDQAIALAARIGATVPTIEATRASFAQVVRL